MGGLIGSKRWDVLPSNDEIERRLVEALGISPLVARVLTARGLTDVDQARAFLSPSLERDWYDPLLIPGMHEAADRVERAINDGETIAVFGDFDVDGMSATCLLTLGLRDLGGHAYPFIPNRFGEGYGLSEDALERVIEGCDPSLIITVDNGIAAAKEVEWLVGQGIDVVITDHHEPGDLVPVGVPVTDPKLLPDCPSRELAGAGVALKLIDVLGHRMGQPELWRRYTEVATLGTISDMMLLVGENRALVADGIAHMRFTSRPGILALAATAGVDITQITADELPFSLIPRLNAAGRMGLTDVAYDLLFTDDPAEASVLAARLEQINAERREIESELTDAAMAEVARTYDGGRVVVAAGEGWHEGVKGIVASRITNAYHVPAIMFSITDGMARGSGRSVGSVDLFHAVEECSDLLVRFGGHAGAVGVTCEVDKLDEFTHRLEDALSELPEEQFVDRGEVAALVSLSEMSVEGIDQLDVLQPFGQGNKKPLLGVRGVCMRNRARVGATGNHLRFVATDGQYSTAAIMFRTPDIARAVACDEAVDLVFEAVSETWQGRTKPKLMIRDILYRDDDEAVPEGQDSVADDLFARADEILARDAYASIAQATRFVTKVVGVTFEGRQTVVSSLSAGQELTVIHEADNPYDENAIALRTLSGAQVGFLRRQIAAVLAPNLDVGIKYQAFVSTVTGGDEGRSYGANIEVSREDATREEEQEQVARASAERARLSALGPDALSDELRHAMIGEHQLLPAQAAALDQLAAGISTLCVMATGRGKSLIFHMHAAREALLRGRASVFVYPLRALVADQSFHLEQSLGKLGLHVRVITGETQQDERSEVFESVRDGLTDVVLTTPEFLTIHADQFAATGRFGFVVIDEAHHAGTAKGGNRSAYMQLPQVREMLGNPVVLAVTATAADDVSREICRLAGIAEQNVIIDRSVRSNLGLRDCREIRDRETALVSLVSSGRKCVIYVNSREQSIRLARMLRKSIPELGRKVSFYNAGLTREERLRVEEAFRSGALTCIVSTSAFGEGVNLPDIRDVVLYHLPFGSIEFNQMSGRAGRDGAPAMVHLLFGERDAQINEYVIGSSAPSRNDLVTLYRSLVLLGREAAAGQLISDGSFALTNAQIADRALSVDPRTGLDERSVSCGIAVFRELGFLETSGHGTARRIRMVADPPHMDLEQSTRYLEGLRSRDAFAEFRDWALHAEAEEMLGRINRPITPSFGRVVDGL
ncbi:MAG: single-stranded-DNA-specific exonuclease RecJ [Atopobiaceae bacterium]|nr:single-stranded-DNA-specific exonuclease RecJ [Atopobiaceae bacterium]